MNGSVIDTNVITKMLINDQAAIDLLSKVKRAYVPVQVVGELFYGAEKSTRRQENMDLFENVLVDFEILPTSKSTAASYAIIKAKLVKAGYNIPDNDIWIAAAAHEHNLTVATFDNHFAFIQDIDLLIL
jgi:predicted nucleic acid-binding protein